MGKVSTMKPAITNFVDKFADKYVYIFLSIATIFVFLVFWIGYGMDYRTFYLKNGTLEKTFKHFLINHSPKSFVSKTSKLINKTILEEKMAKGLDPWAKAQINEDLLKIKNVNSEELLSFFKEQANNYFFHVQVKNGKVKISGLETLREHSSIILRRDAREVMEDVLGYLSVNKLIPNTEFIISLADYVYRPENIPVPVFTFSKDLDTPREKDLILIPDWMNLRSNVDIRNQIKSGNEMFPWEKKKPLAVWRGGENDSTGFREKMVNLTKLYPNIIDAEFVGPNLFSIKTNINRSYYMSTKNQLEYKYLVTIDGYRGAWERVVWQLFSNSLMLKHQTNQVQWFYNGIKPNVHYLSFKNEDELLQKIKWAENHQEEVKLITKNANNFAENNLTLEDMYHYTAVLLQEYTKKVNSSDKLETLNPSSKAE
jgi:hypothetical protein